MGTTTAILPFIINLIVSLLFCGAAIAAVVLAVLLWREMQRLRASGLNASSVLCGRCRHAAEGWTTATCPECGTDSREVGVVPAFGRARGLARRLLVYAAVAVLPIAVFASAMLFASKETTVDATWTSEEVPGLRARLAWSRVASWGVMGVVGVGTPQAELVIEYARGRRQASAESRAVAWPDVDQDPTKESIEETLAALVDADLAEGDLAPEAVERHAADLEALIAPILAGFRAGGSPTLIEGFPAAWSFSTGGSSSGSRPHWSGCVCLLLPIAAVVGGIVVINRLLPKPPRSAV
jgi:hypothetical protein